MWASRLFWKLFIAYAGLTVAATALFAALISTQQRAQVEAYLEERLRDDAALLRSQVQDRLDSGNDADLQRIVHRLSAETKIQITVTDSRGTVLADSDQDPRQMENHRSRPEIEIAAREGVGVCTVRRPAPSAMCHLLVPPTYFSVHRGNYRMPIHKEIQAYHAA